MFTSKVKTPYHQPEQRCCNTQNGPGTHVQDPDFPSPESWGMSKNSKLGWVRIWILLSDAAMLCSELLRCGCKKKCRRLCKCIRAHL
ncbi:hypothetical protein Pmani_020156 [Petrolisthes manimaculis]|uniref:Uncharacterized protein n=1 Tax=Petrolisthes manimaculis TaxID=1843537 RepID=A0AAE1PIZ6_9EUCA|nr:hypothetical protein Pmani_020156 [Petrolisthes manimaculis]